MPQDLDCRNRDVAALIALGANAPSPAGGPAETLAAALARLAAAGVRLRATSRFFRTPAFPPGAGAEFVNAAALLSTALPPEALLALLHEQETAFGRVREGRWGPRTLDLDLLAVENLILPDAEEQTRWRALPPEAQTRETPGRLILPHPRLQDRAFVLVPLLDVAPLWRHPLTGLSVAEMAAALPGAERAEVRPIGRD